MVRRELRTRRVLDRRVRGVIHLHSNLWSAEWQDMEPGARDPLAPFDEGEQGCESCESLISSAPRENLTLKNGAQLDARHKGLLLKVSVHSAGQGEHVRRASDVKTCETRRWRGEYSAAFSFALNDCWASLSLDPTMKRRLALIWPHKG